MSDGWYGRNTDASTATSPPDAARPAGTSTVAPEADYESAWAKSAEAGSGVSGTKLKPVGAPDLALGESSAAAAARGNDKASKRYKQMIVVSVFILLAALSAAIASVLIGGGEDQVADARIDESTTGRDGELGADDAGKPVPAQVAEEPATTAPKSDDGKSGSSKSGGSSSSKAKSSSGNAASAPVPQAVGAAVEDLGIGPVNDSATVRVQNGKLTSDKASTLENPKPIPLTVGSTFTITGNVDKAALSDHGLWAWDLAGNKVGGDDDGTVLQLASSADALYRFKAVGPGAVVFQMRDPASASSLLFIFVVV